MKASNVQLIAAVSALFLMTGFQSAKAQSPDTVKTTATVTSPTDGSIFYIDGSTLPDVTGSAKYTGFYQDGDPTGTAAKYVPIHITYTLTHAYPGGTVVYAFINSYGTYDPGDTYTAVPISLSTDSTFPAGSYATHATSVLEADTPSVTITTVGGGFDTHWIVTIGESSTPPSGGGSCQAKAISSKKLRRHQPIRSHFAL